MWVIISILAIGFTVALIVLSSRFARGINTMWLITTAVKNGLPLPELLIAQSRQVRGYRRRGLQELAEMLREGVPLEVATEAYKDLLPYRGRLSIRVGGESGTLGETLEMTARQLEQRQRYDHFSRQYLLVYVVAMIDLILLISFFLTYSIIPTFKEIFHGFGVELPAMTLVFISVSDLVVIYIPVLVPLFFIPLLLLNLYAMTPALELLRRLERVRGFRIVIGAIIQPLQYLLRTLVLRWFPARATEEILSHLTVAATAGKPLLLTIESLGRHYPAPDIRKKLQRVGEGVAEGNSLWTELSRVGFLTAPQAGILQTAEVTGELPFGLAELNRLRSSRLRHREMLGLETLRCVVVFVLSGWVALIGIAMFIPLVELMRDLA